MGGLGVVLESSRKTVDSRGHLREFCMTSHRECPVFRNLRGKGPEAERHAGVAVLTVTVTGHLVREEDSTDRGRTAQQITTARLSDKPKDSR